MSESALKRLHLYRLSREYDNNLSFESYVYYMKPSVKHMDLKLIIEQEIYVYDKMCQNIDNENEIPNYMSDFQGGESDYEECTSDEDSHSCHSFSTDDDFSSAGNDFCDEEDTENMYPTFKELNELTPLAFALF